MLVGHPGGIVHGHVRAVQRRHVQAPAAHGLRAVPAVASPVPVPADAVGRRRAGVDRGIVQPRVKHVHLARLGVGLHVGDPAARPADVPAAQQDRGGSGHVVRVHDRRAVRVVAALHGVCSQVQPVVRRVERHVPYPKVAHGDGARRAVRVVRGDGVRRHGQQVAEVDIAGRDCVRVVGVYPDKVVVQRVERASGVAPDKDAAGVVRAVVRVHGVAGEPDIEIGRVGRGSGAAGAVRARARAHGERTAAGPYGIARDADVVAVGPDCNGRP